MAHVTAAKTNYLPPQPRGIAKIIWPDTPMELAKRNTDTGTIYVVGDGRDGSFLVDSDGLTFTLTNP